MLSFALVSGPRFSPTWFSMTHFRPPSSSQRGGPFGAAPPLFLPAAAGFAGDAAAAAGTAPERSPWFLVFMSSVTFRSPPVTAPPCSRQGFCYKGAMDAFIVFK